MNQAAVIDNANSPFRDDAKVIGLVGLGHAISHFSQLVLPPLFPLLKTDFGISNVQLGVIMAAFFIVSGIGQALAGFLVDRVGARGVLFAGIAIIGLAIFGVALSQNYISLVICGALLGLGNCIISRIHTFQACSFNHSDISPQNTPDVHPAASQRSPGR